MNYIMSIFLLVLTSLISKPMNRFFLNGRETIEINGKMIDLRTGIFIGIKIKDDVAYALCTPDPLLAHRRGGMFEMIQLTRRKQKNNYPTEER